MFRCSSLSFKQTAAALRLCWKRACASVCLCVVLRRVCVPQPSPAVRIAAGTGRDFKKRLTNRSPPRRRRGAPLIKMLHAGVRPGACWGFLCTPLHTIQPMGKARVGDPTWLQSPTPTLLELGLISWDSAPQFWGGCWPYMLWQDWSDTLLGASL